MNLYKIDLVFIITQSAFLCHFEGILLNIPLLILGRLLIKHTVLTNEIINNVIVIGKILIIPKAVLETLKTKSPLKSISLKVLEKSNSLNNLLKNIVLVLYKFIDSEIRRYMIYNNIKTTIENINKVITVAEKAGLKDNLLFMKLYTGYIINDIDIPITKGSKYRNKHLKRKNTIKYIAKKRKFALYLLRKSFK